MLATTYTEATEHTPADIYADCAGLVSFRDRQTQALAYSCPMAGLWRQITKKPAWPYMRIHKTKAHRSQAQAALADDQQHYLGNEVADTSAKSAAAKHRVPEPALAQFLKAARDTQTSLTRAVEALIKYNSFVVPLELHPLQVPPRIGDPRPRHSYQQQGPDTWACRWCGHNTRTTPFGQTIKRRRPLSQVIFNLFTKYIDAHSRLGHSLYIANSNPSTRVVYCSKCGSYGTHRFANLSHPCRAHTSGQTGLLPYFANKTHPNGTTLQQVTQVSFGFIQALCSQLLVNEDIPTVCSNIAAPGFEDYH